jgi:hypothetical protein
MAKSHRFKLLVEGKTDKWVIPELMKANGLIWNNDDGEHLVHIEELQGFDKVNIYTWLAWQEQPGKQLHQALQSQILDPKHTKAQPFVDWFRQLYQL